MSKRYILRFDALVSREAIKNTLQKLGVKIRYIYDLIPAAAADCSKNQVTMMKAEPQILAVVPDSVSQPSKPIRLKVKLEDGTYTYLIPTKFGSKPETETLNLKEQNRPSTHVAVLDTGVDNKHPLLVGKIVKEVDFTGEGPFDFNGHGTLVACNLSSPHLRVVSIKVANKNGIFWESDVMAGIEWAAKNNVRIANLSSGFYRNCEGHCPICSMTTAATQNEMMLVAAAGNTPGLTACPAKLGLKTSTGAVLAVGAYTQGKLDALSGTGSIYNESSVSLVPFRASNVFRSITVDLPRGFSLDDSWVQQAEVVEFSGFDEKYIFDTVNIPDNARTTELLTRKIHFKGVKEEQIPEIVWNLSLGDRFSLLFHLRDWLMPNVIRFSVNCPSCNNRSEAALPAKSVYAPVDLHPHPEYMIKVDGFVLRVHPITGADVERATSSTKPNINEQLVRSCVVSSDPPLPDQLSIKLLADIIVRLKELDPQGFLYITLLCSTCSNKFEARFDFERFFFSELETRRALSEKEVSSVAYNFDWSVEDVLALPSLKRREYFSIGRL